MSPHQKNSDGSPSEESRQDISPVVAVLSHPDYAYYHSQTEQGEADGGLGQPCAFGLEHQRHVHLQKGIRGEHAQGTARHTLTNEV